MASTQKAPGENSGDHPDVGQDSEPCTAVASGNGEGVPMKRLVVIGALVVLMAGCAATPAHPHPTHTHSPAKVATTTYVNNVVGLKYSDVQSTLRGNGLTAALDVPDTNVDSYPMFYTVRSQTPPVNTKVKIGSTVTLHVEVDPITAPNVVGQTLTQAEEAIKAATGQLTATPDAGAQLTWTVQTQNPAAGTPVKPGTSIALSAPAPQVVFSVWGDGSESNVITYTIPGSFNIEQAAEAALPWSMAFPYTGSGYLAHGNLSAQDDDGSSISCAISVNGKIVDQHTATGQYAIVQCGG